MLNNLLAHTGLLAAVAVLLAMALLPMRPRIELFYLTKFYEDAEKAFLADWALQKQARRESYRVCLQLWLIGFVGVGLTVAFG